MDNKQPPRPTHRVLFERVRVLAYMRHARDSLMKTDLSFEDKQDFLREFNLLQEAYEIKLKETQ
jgi:hypothetical protein